MKAKAMIGLSAALLGAPGMGLGFLAFNRADVYPLKNGVFEVVSRIGSAPTNYWCGAGAFVINQLGARGNSRVYLWKEIGPSLARPGKKAAQFSLTAPEGVDTTPGYSVTVKRVGDNMSASMARNYCYDNLYDDFWF